MSQGSVHLILRISTQEPIELTSFVSAFSSLESEFARYISDTNPDLKSDAKIFIQEIKQGSIEANMFPVFETLAGILTTMDQMLIIQQFVEKWGSNLKALIVNAFDAPSTKSELKDWAAATEAIAKDPNGSMNLEASYFEDGEKQIKSCFYFNSRDARKAQSTINKKHIELDDKSNNNFERVFMVFTRTDKRYSEIGKRSGELVLIESIHNRPLPLMYGSNLSEDRIKHEVREADDNIYKKGFSVDVNVEYLNNKPRAYSITNVHQVFDISDD